MLKNYITNKLLCPISFADLLTLLSNKDCETSLIIKKEIEEDLEKHANHLMHLSHFYNVPWPLMVLENFLFTTLKDRLHKASDFIELTDKECITWWHILVGIKAYRSLEEKKA